MCRRYTEIVEYGKYYPLGERGVAGERANCFTYDMGGSLNDWFRIANEETLLIPQCETVGCLKGIDNIVRVDGIAGMFVGPYDLSTAMGIPGQFDNPDFLKAIQKVVDACHAAGKFCITYCDSAQKARQYFAMNFDSATIGLDVCILVDGYRQVVREALQEA